MTFREDGVPRFDNDCRFEAMAPLSGDGPHKFWRSLWTHAQKRCPDRIKAFLYDLLKITRNASRVSNEPVGRKELQPPGTMGCHGHGGAHGDGVSGPALRTASRS